LTVYTEVDIFKGMGWSAMGASDTRLIMLLHGAQVISDEQDVGRGVRNRF